MNIEKTQSGSDLVISLDGRLDTTTAPTVSYTHLTLPTILLV